MEIVGSSERGGEISFKDEEIQPSASVSLVSKFAHLCSASFFRLSESLHYSFLPLHPGEYGQKNSKQLEVVRRVLWGAFQLPATGVALPFAAVGLVCHGVSNLMNRMVYRMDRGTFSGEMNKHTTLMTLNPRMYRSFPFSHHGGVMPWKERHDQLVRTVRDNNPDILFLPEMNASARNALRKELDDRYHYFFSNMGRRTLGFEASFFIAFRGKLESKPEYVRFSDQGLVTEKGFFHFEANQTHYFCTASPNLQDLEEMSEKVKEGKKVVFMIDTTYEKSSAECAFLKARGFTSIAVKESNAPAAHLYGTPLEENANEGIFMRGAKGETDIVPMHHDQKIDEALSDKPMFLTIV